MWLFRKRFICVRGYLVFERIGINSQVRGNWDTPEHRDVNSDCINKLPLYHNYTPKYPEYRSKRRDYILMFAQYCVICIPFISGLPGLRSAPLSMRAYFDSSSLSDSCFGFEG